MPKSHLRNVASSRGSTVCNSKPCTHALLHIPLQTQSITTYSCMYSETVWPNSPSSHSKTVLQPPSDSPSPSLIKEHVWHYHCLSPSPQEHRCCGIPGLACARQTLWSNQHTMSEKIDHCINHILSRHNKYFHKYMMSSKDFFPWMNWRWSHRYTCSWRWKVKSSLWRLKVIHSEAFPTATSSLHVGIIKYEFTGKFWLYIVHFCSKDGQLRLGIYQ